MARVWLLLVLLLPSAARAQDTLSLSPEERTARAKALFEEGRAHVDLGDYATATREFEQAYVLKPLPLLLYNLAELATYQNRRERALQLYGRYLQTEHDPKERALVERRMSELRQSLAKDPEPPSAAVAPSPPPPSEPSPPPTTTTTPAQIDTTLVVKAPPATAARHPSRRWIWGVVAGGAVVVAGVVALGIVFGTRTVDPSPSLGLGHLQ
jgi:tetratricopeptide (TPR) repeat protein